MDILVHGLYVQGFPTLSRVFPFRVLSAVVVLVERYRFVVDLSLFARDHDCLCQ